MPNPVSQTCPVAEFTSTLAGLMSLWMSPRPWSWPSAADRATASRRNRPVSMGWPDKAIEGLASRVLDNQHRPPALAYELHRPQRPRTVEVVLKFVFVCETIDALKRRMLSAGKNGYESMRMALSIIAPYFAEDTFSVFPQHL